MWRNPDSPLRRAINFYKSERHFVVCYSHESSKYDAVKIDIGETDVVLIMLSR